MNIHITGNTTIREVQKIFQNRFPFLKIEFSDRPHSFGERAHKGHWYDPCFRLLDIARRKNEGYLQLRPWNSTGEVEQHMAEELGLFPQVFRLEKGRWIETAGTDVISLEEQNEIAKMNLEEEAAGWIERECLL